MTAPATLDTPPGPETVYGMVCAPDWPAPSAGFTAGHYALYGFVSIHHPATIATMSAQLGWTVEVLVQPLGDLEDAGLISRNPGDWPDAGLLDPE